MVAKSRGRQPGEDITLPLLSKYLSFSRIFGFNVNPNDESHLVDIINVNEAQQRRRRHKRLKESRGHRAAIQQTLRLMAKLRWLLVTVIKELPLLLASVLAVNHIIVLIYYVQYGSKMFMDLMFELRLVITKVSVLMFLISWRLRRVHICKVIKLVKSTSIYIMSAASEQTDPTSNRTAELISWRPRSANQMSFRFRAVHHSGHERKDFSQRVPWPPEEQPRHRQPIELGSYLERHLRIGYNAGGETNNVRENLRTNEIVLPQLKHAAIDRQVRKWWLTCCWLILFHFALSEIEVLSSRHLWEWLSDYSFQQLNNSTTTRTSLLVLASFDNYVYTVHVYGARLVGASIICIICSLQCESIESLRWETLKLIRRIELGGQSARLAAVAEASPPPNSVDPKHWTGSGGVGKPTNWRHKVSARVASWRRFKRQPATIGNHHERNEKSPAAGHPLPIDANARLRPQQAPPTSLHSWQPTIDRRSFFILAESDWLVVHHEMGHKQPCGHLSGPVWQLRGQLAGQINWLLSMVLKPRRSRWMVVRELVHLATLARMTRAHARESARVIGQPADVWWPRPAQADHVIKVTPLPRVPAELCADFSVWGVAKPRPAPPPPSQRLKQQLQQQQQPSVGRFMLPGLALASSAPGWPIMARPPVLGPANEQARRPVRSPQSSASSSTDESATLLSKLAHEWNNSKWDHILDYCLCGSPTCLGSRSACPNASKQISSLDDMHLIHLDGPRRDGNGRETCRPRNTDPAYGADIIGRHLDRLASKYELIKAANGRIETCFGPMLLAQFSSLFLMSCIDLVYFSVCFNFQTKTKLIIISGMLLLWLPFLLLYNFASDIVMSSHELQVSVRRLARLSLVSYTPTATATTDTSKSATALSRTALVRGEAAATKSPAWLTQISEASINSNAAAGRSATIKRLPLKSSAEVAHITQQWTNPSPMANKVNERLIQRLDYIFRATKLSMMGVLTIDKFFLLKFTEIVITASVMTIQFISN